MSAGKLPEPCQGIVRATTKMENKKNERLPPNLLPVPFPPRQRFCEAISFEPRAVELHGIG